MSKLRLNKLLPRVASLAIVSGICYLPSVAQAASLTSTIPGCEFTQATRRNPGTGIIAFSRTCTTGGVPISISGELVTSVQSYTRQSDGRLEISNTGSLTAIVFQLSKFSITNNSTTNQKLTLPLTSNFLSWENAFNVSWASGGGTTYTRFKGTLTPAPGESSSTTPNNTIFFKVSYDNDSSTTNGNITAHGLQAFNYDSGGGFDPVLNVFAPSLNPIPLDLLTTKPVISGNLLNFTQSSIYSATGAFAGLSLEAGKTFALPASSDALISSDPWITCVKEAEELLHLVVAKERADAEVSSVPEPASLVGLLAVGGFLTSAIARRHRS